MFCFVFALKNSQLTSLCTVASGRIDPARDLPGTSRWLFKNDGQINSISIFNFVFHVSFCCLVVPCSMRHDRSLISSFLMTYF